MNARRHYLLSGFILMIIFQQCNPIRFYQDDIQYFTEIPLKDQKQDYTRIYFPDDLKPERPYIEAGLVRVSVRGHLRTQHLAARLRTKAQHLGLDAVIVRERINEGSRGANLGEAMVLGAADGVVAGVLGQEGEGGSSVEEFETYSYSVLEGIGIKYVDNIHTIENSVKSEKVYLADKPGELLYLKEFFLNGETKSIDFDEQVAIHIHDNYVEAFSLHHLINQQANWGYRTYDNKVVKRAYFKTTDWKLKNCRFVYDLNRVNSLKRIVIRYPGQDKKDVIRLFSKLGVVERKEIHQNGVMTITEQLIYDKDDRLVARKIFKTEDEIEKLWLIVHYDFYQNSELKNYIGKGDDPINND